MERQDIPSAMTELKLLGMRDSFDETIGKNIARRDEFYPLIAALIRAEHRHRQARSISYRIGAAKFPVLKDLAKFNFAGTVIDEALVRELATGAFWMPGATRFLSAAPAPARRIYALPLLPPSSAPKPAAGSTTLSIWSINWSRRKPPAAPAGWRRNCCATTSSSSMNWAICHSARPAASCCSI